VERLYHPDKYKRIFCDVKTLTISIALALWYFLENPDHNFCHFKEDP
jgi:hypothetical protein